MQTKKCIQCGEVKSVEAFDISFDGINAKAGFTQRENRKHRCKLCYGLRERIRTKKAFISLYRGKCTCCGEDDPRFLTLDHINNDGNKHRKEVADNIIIAQAIKDYQPFRFQILCFNCNCAKGNNNGVCPHKQLSREEYVNYVDDMLTPVGRKYVNPYKEGLALGPRAKRIRVFDQPVFKGNRTTIKYTSTEKISLIDKKVC